MVDDRNTRLLDVAEFYDVAWLVLSRFRGLREWLLDRTFTSEDLVQSLVIWTWRTIDKPTFSNVYSGMAYQLIRWQRGLGPKAYKKFREVTCLVGEEGGNKGEEDVYTCQDVTLLSYDQLGKREAEQEEALQHDWEPEVIAKLDALTEPQVSGEIDVRGVPTRLFREMAKRLDLSESFLEQLYAALILVVGLSPEQAEAVIKDNGPRSATFQAERDKRHFALRASQLTRDLQRRDFAPVQITYEGNFVVIRNGDVFARIKCRNL